MKSIAVLCFIRKPVYCLSFINWIRLAVCSQKNCDSHQKWLHPEINNNILLLTSKHQNFARFLFQRSANFFFCFVYDFLIEQQYFHNRLRKQKFSTFNSCWILSISCHFTDFYNIKGQYLKAQTNCHIKRTEQEPCTYPMPILISLAFLMGYQSKDW